jgi:6-phosphogluconolactonase
MNPATGELTFTGQTADLQNPSYVTLHPSGRYLYAVSEVDKSGDQQGGTVSAFKIDPDTGGLTLINQQLSHGSAPCHVSVDATGHLLTVANYSSGTVAALPVRDNGSLGEATSVEQHVGSSVNPQRQKEPHAHSCTIDAANKFAFAADLGLDKVYVYKLDVLAGKLIPNEVPFVRTHPGAGPRHFAFHPNNRYGYVINEIDSTITSFTYDADKGALNEIQSISTLPADFKGASSCADIHIAPSGKFLYGSNRGHDSIAIFAIDEATGKLTLVAHQSTLGKTPRNFALDPSGKFLVAANQDTSNAVVFNVDQQTGRLTPSGHEIQVPFPVCVKFLP